MVKEKVGITARAASERRAMEKCRGQVIGEMQHSPLEEESLRRRTVGDECSVVGSSPTRKTATGYEKHYGLGLPLKVKEEEEGRWMLELSRMVREKCKRSSWWEKYGVDWTIIGLAMSSLPAGFLCVGSQSPFLFVVGILILGLAHSVITVKGSHMASHRTLCQSPTLGRFWATFFIEVCSSLPVPCGQQGHVKLHHGHTNVIGLGDSSVWKAPGLSCGIYMFLAPLALPFLTLLVGLRYLKQMEYGRALSSLFCISLGLWFHFQLLVTISGLGFASALGCMFLTRAMLAIPFIHVNIFQHIGLPMFSPSHRPPRLRLMSHSVLNLPRNLLLDWTFGHSLISCHVEHHLFPQLSDHMCLKMKPLVSAFLREHNLPYQGDTYMSRLRLFLSRYEELMVLAPPIMQLADLR
ncbi:fatty acid desaturase 6 [Rhinophrynus dorsalis]